MLCIGFVGFSTKSFAQVSTPLKPYDGATHTYTFDGMTDGYKYQFYLTTNPQEKDNTVAVPANSGVLTGATGTVGADATGKATVSIKWDAAASGTYNAGNPIYLFLKIWDEAPATNVCENYKAVQIIPVPNDFNVLVADVTVTGEPESCPELDFAKDFQPVIGDVNIDADPETEAYSAGYSEIAFKVSREGTNNAWDFNFTISSVAGANYTYSVVGANTAEVTGDQDTSTKDIAVDAADDFVTITLKVPNVAGANPDLTFTINSAQDNLTKAADLAEAGTPADPEDDTVTHTINVLPVIGNFIGS